MLPITPTPVAPPPLRIALLLLPSFPSLGLAAVVEPMAIGNWLSQKVLFEWTLLSFDGEPVQASNGLVSAVSDECMEGSF